MHSLPVRPVAPNTATDMLVGARSAFAAVARKSNFIITAATLVPAKFAQLASCKTLGMLAVRKLRPLVLAP